KEEILETRRKAYLANGADPSQPVTFLDGKPVRAPKFGGVQIWGVKLDDPAAASVTTVDCPRVGKGRLWTQGNFRYLHVPAVRGTTAEGTLAPDAESQAERMFLNAQSAMTLHGFSYSSVVRTWIYIRRLLDWYAKFNQVRSRIYGQKDFFGQADDVAFPASTGIQCGDGDAECVMDVLVLDAVETGSVRPMPLLTSSYQGRAFSYGSAFSRAMVLGTDRGQTIHISGTASVNGAGESVYRDDREMQSLRTLLSVSALLKNQGAALDNICSATLFCKDKETYEAYLSVTRLLGIPSFPTIFVLAGVCRHDLLIEMEAVGICQGAPSRLDDVDKPRWTS
ncbi:MAG: hypothetical protein A3G75_10760, partial [Verrucomicrobia bacterium RIFCSPLOWO2_12_FULL_64_8]